MDTALLTLKSLQLRGQKTRAFSNKKTSHIGEVPQAPRVNARETMWGYVQATQERDRRSMPTN